MANQAAIVFSVIFCLLTYTGTFSKGPQVEQEELLKQSKFVFRRNSGGDADYQLRFAHDSFVATTDATVERLIGSHSPILVHTREEEADILKFVRVNSNVTITLPIQTYNNLKVSDIIDIYDDILTLLTKAITHLPVTAISVLIPEVTEEPAPPSSEAIESLQQLKQVLQQSSTVVNGGAFDPGPQTSRQMEIIGSTLQFVSRIINSEEMVSMETLSMFAQSLNEDLMENAREAVRDYLICLNETITALLRDQDVEWQTMRVVVELEPFARPTSFIVQYYEALLNSSLTSTTEYPRIILLPSRDQNSSLLDIPSVYASVRARTAQNLSELFYRMVVPTHEFLSEAAADLICSDDLELPSCNSVPLTQSRQKLPSGFVTAVERTYVIVIIFIGTSSVVLGITLLCIYLEGRAVKRERREEMERIRRYDGPNVFSDVDGKLSKSKDEDSSSTVLTKRVQKGESVETDSTSSLEDESRPKSVTHSEVSLL